MYYQTVQETPLVGKKYTLKLEKKGKPGAGSHIHEKRSDWTTTGERPIRYLEAVRWNYAESTTLNKHNALHGEDTKQWIDCTDDSFGNAQTDYVTMKQTLTRFTKLKSPDAND